MSAGILVHREGERCRVNHTDNRPRERYCSENVGKQGWLVRGWSSVNTGLQSFPWRWLRQLAAGGAFILPKHNSEKEGKKRYLYPLNQEHDSSKRST